MVGGQDHRRGQHRALGREVQLGEPHRVETPALRRIDLGERIGEGLRGGLAGQRLKLVEHSEFHRSSSPSRHGMTESMPSKRVLIAGATGLVGYAALKHFGSQKRLRGRSRCRAAGRTRLSARAGIRSISPMPRPAQALRRSSRGVTHLVYAALYERPGLVAGWREDEQIRTNDLMLRNLLGPLERARAGLRHVALLQGTKAYGVHVRPLAGAGAREPLGDARAAQLLLEPGALSARRAAGQGVELVDPAAGADRGRFGRQRHERDPGARRLCRHDAARRQDRSSTIPAASAAWRRRSIPTCWRAPSPGRASRTRRANEIFNVTNGDVFVWPNVWPAIADALGFAPGEHVPLAARQARSARRRRRGPRSAPRTA